MLRCMIENELYEVPRFRLDFPDIEAIDGSELMEKLQDAYDGGDREETIVITRSNTPRLDFRGAFEYASDLYFVRDFFSDRYAANPQPATFAAFEQQFDHFSASIYFRPRTNSFYTVSEKLPEVRLDIPRQEILNTNFYYQGDFDASYNRMQWIKFDYKHDRETGTRIFNKLKDYQAYRFDTTHFLYFPIRLDWLTIVPRAGFKMTVYSKSSDDENSL